MIELSPLYARILIGVGIKTIGYILIAAGIFLSLRDKNLALQIVYLGVGLVLVGWMMIIRTLHMAKLLKIPRRTKIPSPKKRTKVVATLKCGGIISEGENITISGRVQYYDEHKKIWRPVSGYIKIVLDERDLGKIHANNSFNFTLPAVERGKHKVEIRFIGNDEFESSYRTLRFQVVDRDEKIKLTMMIRLAYGILLLFVLGCVIFLLMCIKLKSGPGGI